MSERSTSVMKDGVHVGAIFSHCEICFVFLFQAQFYIFERVRAESMINEEIHLRAEILVPKSSIGRIIGKGGQNVSLAEILFF